MVTSLLLRRASAFAVPRRKLQLRSWRQISVTSHQQQQRSFSLAATAPPEGYRSGLRQKQQREFKVTAPYEPSGDQPQAIRQLMKQLEDGDKFSILRGITGTGKTFVMSHVIAKWGRPTLVLCHNKTLAAQLARELRSFLKENAVELFVSYYNHYIPESYVETTGTYIAKKSSINDEIDALRHRATRALLERNDVVIVASVSCIYGLGLPAEYLDASTSIEIGESVAMGEFVERLEGMLYTRPDDPDEMLRGNYQVRSSSSSSHGQQEQAHVLSLWPPQEKAPVRIEFVVSKNRESHVKSILVPHASGAGLQRLDSIHVFPAKHHVTSESRLEEACLKIEEEMRERVEELKREKKFEEAGRLQQRVMNDLLLLRETGFCSGVENYSRHFAGREAGEPPDTLMDYMRLAGQGDWLLVVDESHVTLPQLKAMYGGDQARKHRLVKHGYRLPSALDNRPLRDVEFWSQVSQGVFVSATPSPMEVGWSPRPPIEMLIRPTYVCDPVIQVRKAQGQLEDLLEEIKLRAEKRERTLAMALTKRDSEDLASYIVEQNVNATYIHSGLTTHERSEALKALQSGEVDCLVGVNCLREGLDLPEVSLVAILNADSEGFLRSETALLQIVGRAARNVNGQAIFYANRITESMEKCMDATNYRREKQLAYNKEHGCKSRSTSGSSTMSIFDLLKDEIEDERKLEVVWNNSQEKESVPEIELPVTTVSLEDGKNEVVTDHLPSKPGVYFWKDSAGNTLYIGKAKQLRRRVKSYLSPGAKHSPRIEKMLSKATSVDFVLTPSDRDALVLESNLIKHHQPPYNVLLKDDEAYPYICASVGDPYPRFSAVPRRQAGELASKYRYFGPYPHFNEINAVLEEIEAKYDLRGKSFQARHGAGTKEEYNGLFNKVLKEVFESDQANSILTSMRSNYEEAALLFDSKYNKCRDVVAIAQGQENKSHALVHVVQLREGVVAGRFSYSCTLPDGMDSEEDLASVMETVLQRSHYPAGEEAVSGGFCFFPNEVLLQYPLEDSAELRQTIRASRMNAEAVGRSETGISSKLTLRSVATQGRRKETDLRAIEFAVENAKQALLEREIASTKGATRTSVDGTAVQELAEMLEMEKLPKRIECYDISHSQGESAVGSRVVFLDGKPQPSLYRKFNIRTVEGIDDYASISEVLERRFKRVWMNDRDRLVEEEDPWSLPDLILIDGGVGQLGAAAKGMANARVFPRQPANRNLAEGDMIMEEDAELVDFQLVDTDRSTTVPLCSLAKNKEEVFVYGKSGPVNETPDSAALLLLRSLRDESHRFALAAHRKRRSRQAGLKP